MTRENSAVAVYRSHTHAASAVQKLRRAGVDMKMLSIACRDDRTGDNVTGCYDTGDRTRSCGPAATPWGGPWSMFLGAGLFAIPGLGPLIVAGPLVAWVVGVLEGAIVVSGMSAIGAGLYNLGVPRERVRAYETALKIGKLVFVAHGTAHETARARDIILQTAAEVSEHHQPEVPASELSAVASPG